MTETTDPDAAHVPPMYATRYTLDHRHLYCDMCGTPHLPETAIVVFAAPPTQKELLGRIHMHEIAHVGTAATTGVDTSTLEGKIDRLAQHLQNLIVQTSPQCATCAAEMRTGTRPGANLVNVIIDGSGYCHEHVDLVGGRLRPRGSSGLIIASGS